MKQHTDRWTRSGSAIVSLVIALFVTSSAVVLSVGCGGVGNVANAPANLSNSNVSNSNTVATNSTGNTMNSNVTTTNSNVTTTNSNAARPPSNVGPVTNSRRVPHIKIRDRSRGEISDVPATAANLSDGLRDQLKKTNSKALTPDMWDGSDWLNQTIGRFVRDDDEFAKAIVFQVTKSVLRLHNQAMTPDSSARLKDGVNHSLTCRKAVDLMTDASNDTTPINRRP